MQHCCEGEQTLKHTPGPWEFVPKLTASENHKGFFVRAEKATKNGKWALAEVQPGDEDGKMGAANATLIAAAPDMLEALRKAVVLLAGACVHSPELEPHQTYEAVSAAIAKATGCAA